jgi:hypothetical protein
MIARLRRIDGLEVTVTPWVCPTNCRKDEFLVLGRMYDKL